MHVGEEPGRGMAGGWGGKVRHGVGRILEEGAHMDRQELGNTGTQGKGRVGKGTAADEVGGCEWCAKADRGGARDMSCPVARSDMPGRHCHTY